MVWWNNSSGVFSTAFNAINFSYADCISKHLLPESFLFKAKSLMAATILIWAAGEMSSSFFFFFLPFSFSFKAISNLQSVIHTAQNGNTENVSSPTWRHSFVFLLVSLLPLQGLAGWLSSLILVLKEALTALPAPSHPLGSNYGNNTASQERDRRWWGGIHLQKPVDKNASIFLLTIDVANNNPKFCSRHWFTK